MKVLTADQSVYLPWLGLFHKVALADAFVYMDDVKHSKTYVINRNLVKHPDGRAHRLTVPLVRGNDDSQLISELCIDGRQRWAPKHASVIANFYRRAPYFDRYKDVLEFYERPYTHLADLNYDMLVWFLSRLGIDVPVTRSSSYQLASRSNDYLIGLSEGNGCDVYIFGASGHNYVDTGKWERAGIVPYFQHYAHPEYPQVNGAFVSHLSTIDLLFNCGPGSLDVVMRGNVDRATVRAWARSSPRPITTGTRSVTTDERSVTTGTAAGR